MSVQRGNAHLIVMALSLTVLHLFASCVIAIEAKLPNIVFFLADDLGWNDVSFHGYSEIPTPNIDRLAAEGMILNSHYAQAQCTPSRTALLTGKYPMRLGLQSSVLWPSERAGIPVKQKILPQYLKELGYATHMIGKWHVGYSVKEMTPTYRGFDSFFGYYNGHVDYFTHIINMSITPNFNGFDLWDNAEPAFSYNGQYLTDIFTERAVQKIYQHNFDKPLFLYVAPIAAHWANEWDPVQSTAAYTDRFSHIKHEGRRKYAGVLAALDDSVGKIRTALQTRCVDDNTIIVFVSDNGGTGQEGYLMGEISATYGSNWPLRGSKTTWFEAGIRSVGVIWSRLLKHPGAVWNGLMHLADWLPTLLTAASGTPVQDIDGVDQWESLVAAAPSKREELLHQADAQRGEYALRWKQYKLIVRERPVVGYYTGDHWYDPEDGLNATYINDALPGVVRCDPPKPSDTLCNAADTAPCLFILDKDPCERNNVAQDYPDVLETMLGKLRAYNASGLHPVKQPQDPLGSPDLSGGLCKPWLNLSDLLPLWQ